MKMFSPGEIWLVELTVNIFDMNNMNWNPFNNVVLKNANIFVQLKQKRFLVFRHYFQGHYFSYLIWHIVKTSPNCCESLSSSGRFYVFLVFFMFFCVLVMFSTSEDNSSSFCGLKASLIQGYFRHHVSQIGLLGTTVILYVCLFFFCILEFLLNQINLDFFLFVYLVAPKNQNALFSTF